MVLTLYRDHGFKGALTISAIEPHPTRDRVDVVTYTVLDPRGRWDGSRQPSFDAVDTNAII